MVNETAPRRRRLLLLLCLLCLLRLLRLLRSERPGVARLPAAGWGPEDEAAGITGFGHATVPGGGVGRQGIQGLKGGEVVVGHAVSHQPRQPSLVAVPEGRHGGHQCGIPGGLP